MRVMDLNKLQTFIVVAREGNLTRAAEILCLSQPAVSAHIKTLEEEFGLKLFERVARGMKLTETGKRLVNQTEQALSAVRQISMHAQSLRDGITGEFRIGTITTPSNLRLERTVSILSSRHPNLRISFVQGVSGNIIDWILTEQIEAGYVIGQPEDTRIAAIEVKPVTLRVVAPSAWGDLIKSMDWPMITTLPWILTPAKCSFSSLAQRMFARHFVYPQNVIEADQEHTLQSLATSGIGLTLLQEDVARAAQIAGDVVIWEPGIEFSHVYFVFSREKIADIKLQTIIQIINEIWSLKKEI